VLRDRWAADREPARKLGDGTRALDQALEDRASGGDVPGLYLVLAVVGVPLCAAAAGWLVAGREPPAIARPAIE
jgi:hypothetical protein